MFWPVRAGLSGMWRAPARSSWQTRARTVENTNRAISKILKREPVADPALEEKYQHFCQGHQIEKVSHSPRKYWNVG